jgi:hypothetical protein
MKPIITAPSAGLRVLKLTQCGIQAASSDTSATEMKVLSVNTQPMRR